MIKVEMLKKKTVTASQFTFRTNKKVPEGNLVNFNCPFYGKDGNRYILPYPEDLTSNTNCYAFALGWRLKGKPGKDFIPGLASGMEYDTKKIVDLVSSDLDAVGRQSLEVVYDIPTELPDGEGYWIKCLQDPIEPTELHFQMKDKKSGRWLHKVGWDFSPKVVVRNLELKPKIDLIIETTELFGPTMDRNMVIGMLKGMFPPMMYEGYQIVRSKIEWADNAPYYAFNPLVDPNNFIIYKPLWAMRISD